MLGSFSATRPLRRRIPILLLAARLAFALAQAVVLWGGFTKGAGQLQILPWDKAEHFIAFLGLMLLATPAFPALSPAVLALALAVEGALIEVVQALPLVGRDGDIRDWLADVAGILTVIGVLVAGYVRLRLGEDPSVDVGALLSRRRGLDRR